MQIFVDRRAFIIQKTGVERHFFLPQLKKLDASFKCHPIAFKRHVQVIERCALRLIEPLRGGKARMPVADALRRQLREFHVTESGKDAGIGGGAIFGQPFRASPFTIAEIGVESPGDGVRTIIGRNALLSPLREPPPCPRRLLRLLQGPQCYAVRLPLGFAVAAFPDEPARHP
jgi:hypothetical protein